MAQPPVSQFSGIFVSYRRDDSAGHAGRLFDKLVDHFGKDRVLMDIDTIEPGEDFVTVIENAVGSCEILIAVIGREWLSSADESGRRLDNPNDFVRREIAAALSRGTRVIPVLVQRASMPKPQDLPEDIATLSRRNAIELSDSRWQTDVNQLIAHIERVLAKRKEANRLAEAARQQEEDRREAEEQAKNGAAQAAARQAEADHQRPAPAPVRLSAPQTPRGSGGLVFLCYARADKDFALRLAKALKERGVGIWVDQWDIEPSADWDRSIDHALYGCDCLLIVLSPASVDSQEVRGELRTALEEKKSVLPILYQKCQIPRRLRLIQHFDFTAGGLNDEAMIQRLVNSLLKK